MTERLHKAIELMREALPEAGSPVTIETAIKLGAASGELSHAIICATRTIANYSAGGGGLSEDELNSLGFVKQNA